MSCGACILGTDEHDCLNIIGTVKVAKSSNLFPPEVKQFRMNRPRVFIQMFIQDFGLEFFD